MIDGFDRKTEMETDTSELDLRSQNRNDMTEDETIYTEEYAEKIF